MSADEVFPYLSHLIGKLRKKRGLAALLLFSALTAASEAAQTKVYAAPGDLEGALLQGVEIPPFEIGLLNLAGHGGSYSSSGTATLPAWSAPAFDSLVVSWDADAPPGTSLEVWAQIRLFGEWTEWFLMGTWEATGGASGTGESDVAFVDVDTLKVKPADQKAQAFRLKVVLHSPAGKQTPVVRMVAGATAAQSDLLLGEPEWERGPWVRDLPVPERSQMAEQAAFRRDICSPTSLSMAMAFWGVAVGVGETARAVQDRRTGRFGVWPLNTAVAASKGLSSHVARFNTLRDLQEEVAVGHPVVVSVSFGDGELPGAPLQRTRGHLMVVRGFTEAGDVIVNDPAAPEQSSVRRIYPRAAFRKAWLENKRGLAYLMRPRWPMPVACGLAAVDLRQKPEGGSGTAEDRQRLSQLLFGERVEAIRVLGDWVEVRAPEQPRPSQTGRAGYPGWVHSGALVTPSPAFRPNAVVAATAAVASWQTPEGQRTWTLPLGARVMQLEQQALPAAGGASPRILVRLADGAHAYVEKAAVRKLPLPDTAAQRRAVVAGAKLLLGRRYVWGGRSSVQQVGDWGVDCSGLVSLAYRTAGVDIPRDAQDQYLEAHRLPRAQAPGDLLFLSRPGQPDQINHVAIYSGGEELVESVDPEGVRSTSFERRFGKRLASLQSGDRIGERTLYFATFFTGNNDSNKGNKSKESK